MDPKSYTKLIAVITAITVMVITTKRKCVKNVLRINLWFTNDLETDKSGQSWSNYKDVRNCYNK